MYTFFYCLGILNTNDNIQGLYVKRYHLVYGISTQTDKGNMFLRCFQGAFYKNCLLWTME